MRRAFTVRSDEFEPTEILQLELQDLNTMQFEFNDSYTELFKESFQNLHKAMSIKLIAIEKCQTRLEQWVNKMSKDKGDLSYNFKLLTTEEVKNLNME